MVEIKCFHELRSVNMRQDAPSVFQARHPFGRKLVKALASAKTCRFPFLPQGNGLIPLLAIWMQGKEVLKEKSTERPCENGRNHESPGRNNVLFAEMKFSPVQMTCVLIQMEFSLVQMTYVPVQMAYVPVQMMCVPVQMKFSPVQMTHVPVHMKFSPVQMTYIPVQMEFSPVQMMFAPVQMTFAPVGGY
jgi:hypothetical protein